MISNGKCQLRSTSVTKTGLSPNLPIAHKLYTHRTVRYAGYPSSSRKMRIRAGRIVQLLEWLAALIVLFITLQLLLFNILSWSPSGADDEPYTTAHVRKLPVLSSSTKDGIEVVAPILTKSALPVENIANGVIARAYEAWSGPLPCFAPDDIKQYRKPSTPSNVHRGFMFMKLMKTGGSTAAGINIRIMKHAAQEVQRQKQTKFQFCQGRFEHAWGYDMLAGRPRNSASFAWTTVRDPTERAISQFFHFEVSRKKTAPDDYPFQRYLWSESQILSNYYLQVLNTEKALIYDTDAPALINKIMHEYDFIGVTERMDESAVALMMLLNVKMGSVLFLNAKGNGGYDDGGVGECVYIEPSHVSKGMLNFFEETRWKKYIKWDKLLYQAANRSLDMTIDLLGRASFEENLAKFRHAQVFARERCLTREVFPCTSSGAKNPNKSCLWKDSGCGSDCLDEVATELGLW